MIQINQAGDGKLIPVRIRGLAVDAALILSHGLEKKYTRLISQHRL